MPQRRNILIVNGAFQLRFAFYVCSWLLALSLIYPLIIYNLFDYFVRYIATHLGHTVDPQSLSSLHDTQHQVIWLLVLLQLVFLGVTFLISIFMSHRIAGPLYNLGRAFAEGTKGHLVEKVTFRKNDHFLGLADDYNEMAQALGKRIEGAASKIERSLPAASGDAKRELEEALRLLKP